MHRGGQWKPNKIHGLVWFAFGRIDRALQNAHRIREKALHLISKTFTEIT
jgi:hypothetical protein